MSKVFIVKKLVRVLEKVLEIKWEIVLMVELVVFLGFMVGEKIVFIRKNFKNIKRNGLKKKKF